MATSIEQAFTDALKHGKLPDHLQLIGDDYWTRGRKKVRVPDSEIIWVDGERSPEGFFSGQFVHACAIPNGHLEALMELDGLHQRTVTSQLRHVAKTRAEDEGYTSKREFATAMLREHRQQTTHIADEVADTEGVEANEIAEEIAETALVNDRLVRYGHIPPANQMADSKYLKTPVQVRAEFRARIESYFRKHPDQAQPEEFNISEIMERPSELIDTPSYMVDLAAAMRALIGLSDWSQNLEYGQLKQWDSLAAGYERDMFNIVPYGKRTADEINQLYREADVAGDEIPRAQIERLTEKLRGFREQYHDFWCRYGVALVERERAVNASGIDFGAYRSLADRAKMGVAAETNRRRAAQQHELDRLNAMSDAERATHLKALKAKGIDAWRRNQIAYQAKHDGVAVDGTERRVEARKLGE